MNNDEHKKLVKGIIDHFEAKGLKIISAAYDGFEKCDVIGNHEPDVIAQKSNEENYQSTTDSSFRSNMFRPCYAIGYWQSSLFHPSNHIHICHWLSAI